MTNKDYDSDAERRNDYRNTALRNAESELRDKRSFARSINTQLSAHGVSDPGNVQPFLAGVQVGLQMGEFAIEDHLDVSMLYEPEPDGDTDE